MRIIETGFTDLYVISPFIFNDNRGRFVKTIHEEFYRTNGLMYNYQESFYSFSKKNVVRGMHFQIPPQDHEKLVYVIKGGILDVALDLRAGSSTYGKYFTKEINDSNCEILYIGKGFAHGFLALQEDTIVEYHTSTIQSKEYERGILWDSFGFNWPVNNPIISDRDNGFAALKTHKIYFK